MADARLPRDARAWPRALLASLAASAVIGTVTVLMVALIGREVDGRLLDETTATASIIRSNSDQYISRRVLLLRGTEAFFSASTAVSPVEFERYAGAMSADLPSLRSLNYIGKDGVIRWVVPRRGNEVLIGRSLKGLTGERLAREAALTRQITVSDPVHLLEGGDGLLWMMPLYKGPHLKGYIEAVNGLDSYVEALGLKRLHREYGLRVSDSQGREIFASGTLGRAPHVEPLPLGSRNWTLEIARTQGWMQHLPTYMVVSVGGLLWLGVLGFIWSDWFSASRLARLVDIRTEALAKSRDQLAIILDGVQDAILAIDRDDRIVFANPAARAMLELGPDHGEVNAFRGRFEVYDEQEQPIGPDRFPSAWAWRGEIGPDVIIHYRKAGSHERLRVGMARGVPVIGDDGTVQMVILIMHELTERVRLELQLKQQLEELKQLDRMKNDFLSVVTHELRTPLTSIKGYAEFLEDEIGGPLSPTQRDFLGQIQVSSAQLEALVDDLLDLARLEAGKFTLRWQTVEAGSLVRQVGEAFMPQAQERHITLNLRIPEQPAPFEGDPSRLIQVLNNLVSNALKFTPAAGWVSVTLEQTAAQVRIQVADSGIGIPPEAVPKLFSKFFQVESALNRTYKGTGLGLPITKGLVEAHGGSIEVESRLGAGTAFTVVLPRERPGENA